MKALVVLLCLWTSTAVVTGSDAGEQLFGVKRGSVRLSVAETQQSQIRQFAWIFNSSLIVEYTQKYGDVDYFHNYRETVKFNPTDLSLLIYNLSHTHTGPYSTRVTRSTGSIAERDHYMLRVLDDVPTPLLSMHLLHYNGSSCNLSVTCSAGQDRVSYLCERFLCSQTQSQAEDGVNFSLMQYNNSLQCNVSNPVSSKQVQSQPLWSICTQVETTANQKAAISVAGLAVLCVIPVTLVFAAICAVGYMLWKKMKLKSSSQGNNNPEKSDSSQMPQTVYCTLAHAQQDAPPQQHTPLLTNNSIYSEVRK